MERTYARDKLKPNSNELNSSPVQLHDGKFWLLPKFQIKATYKPVFIDDTVVIDADVGDKEYAKLVNDFMTIFADYDATSRSIALIDLNGIAKNYIHFFKLFKYMIQKNYDLSDEEVTNFLTLNQNQLEMDFTVLTRFFLR
jgi:hypothetical protein